MLPGLGVGQSTLPSSLCKLERRTHNACTDGQDSDLPSVGTIEHDVRNLVARATDVVVGVAIRALPFGKSVDIGSHVVSNELKGTGRLDRLHE